MNDRSATRISGNQGVQVIARAAEVLRVFKTDNSGLSLGEIAKRVSLPRSTVQRIVNALLTENLLVAVPDGGGLRLGSEIQSLAAAGRIDVADLVRPILEELSRETGETVDLSVLRNDHVIFVDQVIGTQKLRTVSAVGEVFTLTNTASGKATLALLEDGELLRLAQQEIASGVGSVPALSGLLEEIKQVRRSQIAFDLDEHTEGVSAVSAAFRGLPATIYSISLPVPTHRFAAKRDELTHALLKAVGKAKEIVN